MSEDFETSSFSIRCVGGAKFARVLTTVVLVSRLSKSGQMEIRDSHFKEFLHVINICLFVGD